MSMGVMVYPWSKDNSGKSGLSFDLAAAASHFYCAVCSGVPS